MTTALYKYWENDVASILSPVLLSNERITKMLRLPSNYEHVEVKAKVYQEMYLRLLR